MTYVRALSGFHIVKHADAIESRHGTTDPGNKTTPPQIGLTNVTMPKIDGQDRSMPTENAA